MRTLLRWEAFHVCPRPGYFRGWIHVYMPVLCAITEIRDVMLTRLLREAVRDMGLTMAVDQRQRLRPEWEVVEMTHQQGRPHQFIGYFLALCLRVSRVAWDSYRFWFTRSPEFEIPIFPLRSADSNDRFRCETLRERIQETARLFENYG